jgi:anti-sigma-K factor RskA
MMNDVSAGAGSYVLDAMDDDEREEFETAVAHSEELRHEVTELTDTAVLLGLAVEPVSPPPALRQNIMARLGQLPQLEREETRVPEESHPRAQARWYRRPAMVMAAAAVVLIAGGVVGTNLAIQGVATNQQGSELASISTASDVRRAEASVSTGGTATLVWSLAQKKAALIAKGLPVLPSGKTYELWYVSSAGKATPAGLFESNGTSGIQVLSGQLTVGDTVGVTIEPSGGSKAPTTKPIVAIAST